MDLAAGHCPVTETSSLDRPPASASRKPVLPSRGGLLGRSFVYRSASKTDVRLTWAQAKTGQSPVREPERARIVPKDRVKWRQMHEEA
jgi:hypothetical protein